MPRIIIPAQIFDEGVLFRRSLAHHLDDFRRDGRGRRASLSGLIEHAGGVSRIVIRNFHRPLLVAPSVDCNEEWIRRTPSWHYEDHSSRFCWVLQEEWSKHFKDRKVVGEPVGIRCQDAASWLMQAMRIVLSRHWIGHSVGLFEWPKEWEDYAHGKEGVKEFHEGKFNNDIGD